MKGYFWILLFGAFLSQSCGSSRATRHQKEKLQYLERYRDQLEPGSLPVTATIQMTIELVKDVGYLKKIYYPPTRQIISAIYYEDPLCQIEQGPRKEWLDNGQLWFEGQYKAGKRTGTWKTYDFDKGYLREQGEYVEDKKEGEWRFFNENGAVIATFQYKNNVQDGPFVLFNESGEKIMEGSYNKGRVEQKTKLKDGFTGLNVELSERPYLAYCENEDKRKQRFCTEKRLSNEIYTQLKYPKFAREHSIEGRVLSKFIVDKNGEIRDLKILRGVNDDIKAECLRVLQKMPAWKAATRDGEAVSADFILPIKFELN